MKLLVLVDLDIGDRDGVYDTPSWVPKGSLVSAFKSSNDRDVLRARLHDVAETFVDLMFTPQEV